MVSKHKKRKVLKAGSETPAPPKPQVDKPTSPEALIKFNGEQVEALFQSYAWKELVFPVLQELVASVSGRLTNGRYYHGSLTRDWSGHNSIFVAGYQKGLMDFHNQIAGFVEAKVSLEESKKKEKAEKDAPIYNPFMEELNDVQIES